MSGKYLAGIDVGTTGSKISVYDLQGNTVVSAYREYSCEYPRPGWVDQDADLVVRSMMDACRSAISESDINSEEIAALAVSAQRCCSHFLDKNGRLVRPMISWMDNRPTEEVAEIDEKIGASRFYSITGMPLNTTWMLPKIMWLRKNEPENWEKTTRICQMHDYALRAFGADDFYLDVSDAAFYGLWDPFKLEWNRELLEAFQIDHALLPRATPSGKKIGVISEEAAALSGFKAGTPLCTGAGDQNSAAVGAGVVHEGFLSITLGTSGNVTAFLDKSFHDPQEKAMVTNHPIYGKSVLEGYIASAAGVWRWFRDEIAKSETNTARQNEIDPYLLLNDLAAKSPAGAKGLVFLPFLASVTAPRWNPEARGTLCGLSFAHNRSDVARAIMEGITLQNHDLIQSMINSGIEIKKARIMGGPTRSTLWNQMQADIYHLPVETLKDAEAGVLGAAIMAGVGSGIFSTIEEGCQAMVQIQTEYTPDTRNQRLYQDLYQAYCSLYEGISERGTFGEIAKLQNTYS